MSQPIVKDEIDILYAASNKLTQASTPAELLDAVSDYARDHGASAGVLLYIDPDAEGKPEWLEIVAEWVTDEGRPMGLDRSFYMPSFAFNEVWLAALDRPTLVEDTFTSDLLDPSTRANYTRFQMRSVALLPMNIKGRWVGLLMFAWREPHRFDERDRRIFTALQQQAGPAIDSVRLYEQTRLRAAELETAKSEMDILYAASNRLSVASTPAEWLDAVSDYARNNGAFAGVLFFLANGSQNEPEWLEVAAEWTTNGARPAGTGRRFRVPGYTNFLQTWASHQNRPMLIPDVWASDLVDAQSRQINDIYRHYLMRGSAILPLNSQGRWVGVLMFTWRDAVAFEERDRRIYTALLQQATRAIDSVLLFQETRERAARAELLLEINAALSGATDETDILSAIARYAGPRGASVLTLSYVDVEDSGTLLLRDVARWEQGKLWRADPEQDGPYPLHQAPLAARWSVRPAQPLLIDGRETLDEKTARTLAERGTQAIAILPLNSGSRWQGVLTVEWREPHTFSAEEQAVYPSLHQTVQSVVTTRRAYLAEEEARRESELLYRMSEAINAATSVEELATALEQLYGDSHGVALSVWENYDFDKASYFEVVATAGSSRQPAGIRYSVRDFPVAPRMRHGVQMIEDMQADPAVDDVSRASWLALGTYARIGVPLVLNNRWMGVLAFHSQRPRIYTPFDRRIVAGVGDLVTAALDRMRLQAATEESRRRAEMLAQVNAALSQATDEHGILAAVATLVEHYNVDFSHLAYVTETDEHNRPSAVEIVAVRAGNGQLLAPDIFSDTRFPTDQYPLLQFMFTHPDEPVVIEDLAVDTREEAVRIRERLTRLLWRATIAIPLKTGDQWLGLLSFLWLNPRTFSAETRALFAEIRPTATSVVTSRLAYLAEQRARQENEQRARELETVARVSAAATTRIKVNELLSTVADLTQANFHLDQVQIYLLDEAGEALVLAESPRDTSEREAADDYRIALGDDSCPVARVGRTQQGMIDNQLGQTPDGESGTASEMAVPMVVGDRLIGVLQVKAREPDRFTVTDLRVMGTLTDLIAVAVDNARLYQQAQELAALEERTRLARELHDSVSQALYGIALGARTARTLLERDPARLAEPLDYILSLAEAGLTEMRALIFQLRPESLENEGIVAALGKQMAALQARHGIKVIAEMPEEPDIPVAIKEAIYLIAREALHNTVKHAKAEQVVVRLECEGGGCVLEICDNGVGFDPSDTFPGHLGLRSMAERVAKLNGTFDLKSAPGEGTRLCVRIPYPA